jgi:hypothetical protein
VASRTSRADGGRPAVGGYEHVDAVTGAGSGSGVNGAGAQKVLTSWHLSDSVVVGGNPGLVTGHI